MTGQGQFTRALTDPDRPVPAGLVSPRGTADTRRFAVYRNNVHVSLVGALAARFPVTRQLVGEAFFTGMARLYVGGHKPQSPVLLHYGDSFPGFIASFPPAARLPYLADTAQLEAAWTDSYNAADFVPMTGADLARLTPGELGTLRIALGPPTRLIASAYPVGAIWSAHQRSPFVPPALTGAEHVLLTRPGADVRLTIIPPAAAQFLENLAAGADLTAASGAVLATQPDFDPGAAVIGLTGLGAFAALQEEHNHDH